MLKYAVNPSNLYKASEENKSWNTQQEAEIQKDQTVGKFKKSDVSDFLNKEGKDKTELQRLKKRGEE